MRATSPMGPKALILFQPFWNVEKIIKKSERELERIKIQQMKIKGSNMSFSPKPKVTGSMENLLNEKVFYESTLEKARKDYGKVKNEIEEKLNILEKDEYKDILKMFYLENLTILEISCIYDCQDGYIKYLKRKALKKLEEIL